MTTGLSSTHRQHVIYWDTHSEYTGHGPVNEILSMTYVVNVMIGLFDLKSSLTTPLASTVNLLAKMSQWTL